jgi:hypothetical protein
VKAEVFVPRMEGPSMSLEEFAAIEVAQAREREARERAGDPNIVKKCVLTSYGSRIVYRICNVCACAYIYIYVYIYRYKQLEADGEEDNIDLVDKVHVLIYASIASRDAAIYRNAVCLRWCLSMVCV